MHTKVLKVPSKPHNTFYGLWVLSVELISIEEKRVKYMIYAFLYIKLISNLNQNQNQPNKAKIYWASMTVQAHQKTSSSPCDKPSRWVVLLVSLQIHKHYILVRANRLAGRGGGTRPNPESLRVQMPLPAYLSPDKVLRANLRLWLQNSL